MGKNLQRLEKLLQKGMFLGVFVSGVAMLSDGYHTYKYDGEKLIPNTPIYNTMMRDAYVGASGFIIFSASALSCLGLYQLNKQKTTV